MSEKSKKNKFEEAISELIRFCDECENYKEEIGCPFNRGCEKYNAKFEECEYTLYSKHPCEECLIRVTCEQQCDKYAHHEKMKAVAKSKLRGHRNLVSEDNFRRTRFYVERIEDIINDPGYPETLEIEKQKYEHFYKDKLAKDEIEIDQLIIDPKNPPEKSN